MNVERKSKPAISSSAFRFVFTLGIVNLFADMTYEGGASINGPFLGTLGAGAASISIIADVGEFLGYSVRLFAGYVADKTGKPWLITFVGYSVNLLAVPAMALVTDWQADAVLVFRRARRTSDSQTDDRGDALLHHWPIRPRLGVCLEHRAR